MSLNNTDDDGIRNIFLKTAKQIAKEYIHRDYIFVALSPNSSNINSCMTVSDMTSLAQMYVIAQIRLRSPTHCMHDNRIILLLSMLCTVLRKPTTLRIKFSMLSIRKVSPFYIIISNNSGKH